MIESLVVTLPPVLFLALLYGSEAVLRLRGVYASGDLPIGKTLFACCKFAIMIPWGVMILRGWGVTLLAPERPEILKWPALGLWILGFALLISGRLGLGRAFRIGLAKEKTSLKENGAFRFSRNPMYLGIDATLAAAALYTVNPIVFAVGVFIAAVHHKIVLAEEARLRNVFGDAFVQYCRRVKRYI
jgi:protein-S-isoprenylcysteine O-methyltransferase Ste14